MGWKGTMRSVGAAVRRAEREAQKQHKAAVKTQLIEDAAQAVENWEEYLSNLIKLHTNLADSMDWKSIAEKLQPTPPTRSNSEELKVRQKIENFKLGGLMSIFQGSDQKRKSKLDKELQNAIAREGVMFSKANEGHEQALAEWREDTEMARRLINREDAAILEVIKEMQSFSEEDLIGSNLLVQLKDGVLHIVPSVHTDEIIPDFRRKQLASGKLSETKMPAGQFNELYQDYVASVALKVVGDTFQLLPLDEVYVTCVTPMLNLATGHKEDTPVLSVQFVREIFEALNLEHIDPSDSLKNFNHAMKFKKTKGFEQVAPLVDFSENY